MRSYFAVGWHIRLDNPDERGLHDQLQKFLGLDNLPSSPRLPCAEATILELGNAWWLDRWLIPDEDTERVLLDPEQVDELIVLLDAIMSNTQLVFDDDQALVGACLIDEDEPDCREALDTLNPPKDDFTAFVEVADKIRTVLTAVRQKLDAERARWHLIFEVSG
jgi:hypothetical protein